MRELIILKGLKRLKASRQAPSVAPSVAHAVAPPVEVKAKTKKTKNCVRSCKIVSRLSKSKLDDMGRNARRCDVGSVHQDIYLSLMDTIRSCNDAKKNVEVFQSRMDELLASAPVDEEIDKLFTELNKKEKFDNSFSTKKRKTHQSADTLAAVAARGILN